MPSITTEQLTMAYADTGPRDGVPVLLIHGWPDDASTWDDVLAPLHAAGLRTIVPTLRGFGDTRLVDWRGPDRRQPRSGAGHDRAHGRARHRAVHGRRT